MANKIYNAPETAVTFMDTDGSYAITLQNLGFGAGRVSSRVDRGAGSQPSLYRWRAVAQWEDNPAVTDYAEVYLAGSDGTKADGAVGATNAALTAAQATNLQLIGVVSAEVASGSADRIASGVCEIYDRYYSVGVFNRSATKNLKNTEKTSHITLTPVPPEVQ